LKKKEKEKKKKKKTKRLKRKKKEKEKKEREQPPQERLTQNTAPLTQLPDTVANTDRTLRNRSKEQSGVKQRQRKNRRS